MRLLSQLQEKYQLSTGPPIAVRIFRDASGGVNKKPARDRRVHVETLLGVISGHRALRADPQQQRRLVH
jgi:hypothetical protein